jgi:hypothetical protein
MKIVDTVLSELTSYIDREVQISEGVLFSQHKLIRRIGIFKNRHFPKGKIDPDTAEYKYWFDIIQPRVNNEIKNLRFSSKNILPFSVNPIGDFAAVFTLHAGLNEWMWETGREDELTDSIERFSGDGNVLSKKVPGGYETCDPDNTYIINQAAKTIEDTPIVERAQFTQSELREKAAIWKNIDEVIKNCGNKFYKKTIHAASVGTTNPLYEIYERNGEISEAALFEAQGKKGGDENKFVLARITLAGLGNRKTTERYILFAEELTGDMCDWFKEAHRGAYKGRWWREGLYELLLDHQYRANEIGNQIARGLDWASRVIFKDNDPQIIQNIRTDLKNGDLIKSANLTQVEVRLQGLDQLIADWNRLMEDADRIANSSEVVTGESLPAGTPFQLASLLDTNASKLFVFLRAKLGHAYASVIKDFVLPELVKGLKVKDIIRVTGDAQFIERFRKLAVDNWYMENLVNIGPHSQDMADALKQAKMKEMEQIEPLIKNIKSMWTGILPRIQITITGENYDISENLQTIAGVLQFEQDPIRRAFLLDTIYAAKGIPVPPPVQPQQQPQQQTAQQIQQPPTPSGPGFQPPVQSKQPVLA